MIAVNRTAACLLVAATVAACSASGATPSPTPAPTPAPEFTIEVLPVEKPVEARVAIPGEKVSFLVVATSAASDEPVQMAATATGAQITDIKPASLKPGVVGEVWLVPDATDVDATVSLEITATRFGVSKSVDRTVKVMPMEDGRAADAQPYFDLWTAWLIANHPELGITKDTTWDPTFVSIFLVVSHYAYFSEDWEMQIAWHNMIPPYDWTEVYLRHRGTESKPSLDFKIDSVSGNTAPHPGELPEAVMR